MIFALSPVVAFAQLKSANTNRIQQELSQVTGLPSGGTNPATALGGTLGNIVTVFFSLLGTVALGYILYAGYLWFSAAGNEEQVDAAKKTLYRAVMGLLVIMLSYAIITVVLNVFGKGPGSEEAARQREEEELQKNLEKDFPVSAEPSDVEKAKAEIAQIMKEIQQIDESIVDYERLRDTAVTPLFAERWQNEINQLQQKKEALMERAVVLYGKLP